MSDLPDQLRSEATYGGVWRSTAYAAADRIEELESQVRELNAKLERVRNIHIGAIPETTDYANGWNECRQYCYEIRQAALTEKQT